MVRSATGPTSASEGVRTPPVSTTESAVPSRPRVPLNRLVTRSELVTMVRPGTSSRHWASANVVVPAATAIAVPGVTRLAAARAMAVFSGRSSTSLASKPGSWLAGVPGSTAPPWTFSTRPSRASTSRSLRMVMSETPSRWVRSLTRALPSLLTACRMSDWRCLASMPASPPCHWMAPGPGGRPRVAPSVFSETFAKRVRFRAPMSEQP